MPLLGGQNLRVSERVSLCEERKYLDLIYFYICFPVFIFKIIIAML